MNFWTVFLAVFFGEFAFRIIAGILQSVERHIKSKEGDDRYKTRKIGFESDGHMKYEEDRIASRKIGFGEND